MSKNTNLNSIVNSLADSAFVPDSRDAGVRASNLSQETKLPEKWAITSIVTYVQHNDTCDSLFACIDAMVEKKDKHLPNGENEVYLAGCELWHNNEDGREFLKLVLKSKDNGAEENVALFPGNEYTDRYGVVHPAGHNWLAFAEEIKAQYNSRHLPYSSKGGFMQLLRAMPTYGFKTWILYDGKYTNMYVTERKYQYAVDRLARESKKGNPVKEDAPVKKSTTKKSKPVADDKPPFDVDKK